MPTHANALVIMTRVPEPGQSKTRLVPPLSLAEAADLARALLVDQLENVAKFESAELFIAFTPENAGEYFAPLAVKGFKSFPQRGYSLGERMKGAFEDLFDIGFSRIVLIGSDLPALPLEFFNQAYNFLTHGKADVVLGPSLDGGYYLLGMRRMIAGIFDGIQWSRNDVLDRTTEKLRKLGLKHELLSPWYDIDTAQDLGRLRSQRNSCDALMKNTYALLNELRQRGKL